MYLSQQFTVIHFAIYVVALFVGIDPYEKGDMFSGFKLGQLLMYLLPCLPIS